MLSYNDEFQRNVSEDLRQYAKTHKFSSLMFDAFLKTLLTSIEEEVSDSISYPQIIKVAKSPLELANGDFEPEYTITIEGCVVRDGHKIWQCTSEDGCRMELGYENFDKRYLSEFSLDAETQPHGTLAGSTGSGKSVTLNAILMSAFYLYPPWELQAYMADPKIAEFKRYGLEHHIPHIKVIAATSDMGYVRSMLAKLNEDMMLVNQAFARTGVRNLKDFREKTGLAVPRTLIVLDEYQTLIKLSSKEELKSIISTIDSFGRLGRNTGYNLLLCSQEVAPEVAPVLKNILNRFCLKVSDSVSNMILGNSQGTTGRVGVLFATSKPDSGDINENHKFMVPYQTDGMFASDGKFLEEVGERVGFITKTMFYDENKHLEQKDLERLCRRRRTSDSLVIGEPSFISDNPDYCEVKFSNTGVDNVLVFALKMKDVTRYFKTFFYNAIDDTERGLAQHLFMVANKSILGEMTKKDFSKGQYFEVTSDDEPAWVYTCEQVYITKLALKIDEKTSEDPIFEVDSSLSVVFLDIFEETYYTKLNLSRFSYLLSELESNTVIKKFFGYGDKLFTGEEVNNVKTLGPEVKQIVKRVFNYIVRRGSNFQEQCLTFDDIPSVYVHVLGADIIKGLGRDGYKNIDYYKDLLYDAYSAKIRFIFYINSVFETLSQLCTSFRYQILDGVEKFSSKIKCDDYPEGVPKVCGVLFDSQDLALPCKCFKKMFLPGDLW